MTSDDDWFFVDANVLVYAALNHARPRCDEALHLQLHTLIVAVAGTYATDPNYARLAAAIASQTNVAQAITDARQQVPADSRDEAFFCTFLTDIGAEGISAGDQSGFGRSRQAGTVGV